jgi:hypothetical protein
MNVEIRHFIEIVGLGNEMASELPVTISTAKSEIWAVRYPETTMETVPATIGNVVEA